MCILIRLFKFHKLVSTLHPALLVLKVNGSAGGLAMTLHTLVASNLGIFAIQYYQNVENNMLEDWKIGTLSISLEPRCCHFIFVNKIIRGHYKRPAYLGQDVLSSCSVGFINLYIWCYALYLHGGWWGGHNQKKLGEIFWYFCCRDTVEVIVFYITHSVNENQWNFSFRT